MAAGEPHHVLFRAARAAAGLCDTPLAAITGLTGDGDQLTLLDVVGTGGRIVERVLSVPGSLNGMVAKSGRTFRSPDVWSDPRRIIRSIAKRNRIRSVLIVPLAARGRLHGTIAVARRRLGSFSARDQMVLEDFASMAGPAIENARLRKPPRRVGGAADNIGFVMDPSLDAPHPVPAGGAGPDGYAAEGFRLTRREREIVDLLLDDRTCQEVAAALGLSIHTVRHHIERLKRRWGRSTLHGLVSLVGNSRGVLS